jgi:3-deoxy-7-phosphoheptulonate synthase
MATTPIPTPTDLPATENVNITYARAIAPPCAITAELPLTTEAHATVVRGRREIRDILSGKDHRLLVVVGPCSIHDPAAARVYAEKLVQLRDRVQEKLLVLMRVYFEKPRTIVGWKGLINDPHLNGTFDMETGLRLARKLLLDVNGMGLPTATELLEPITPQYIDDLVSWAAIGARTTESQTHRQMASGLSMPVGYKNGTDGTLQTAIDAFRSARASHHFLGIDEDGKVAVVKTRGNSDGHVILRGGAGRPNYSPAIVADAAGQLAKAGLPQVLMVDCSHANSDKKHENQSGVWDNVIGQLNTARAGGLTSPIIGLMLESNLQAGRQDIPADLSKLAYGVSVTDACIGWEETEKLLLGAAERL